MRTWLASTYARLLLAIVILGLIGSCSNPVTESPTSSVGEHTPLPDADVVIRLDPEQATHAISPFIYGLSVASTEDMNDMRPGLNSWGGNPNTRYNWRHGNAWNTGSDWFYMNYGDEQGEVAATSDEFVVNSLNAGAAVRIALPTLGWVAKDSDNATCSFPDANGECGDAAGATCENPGPIADPNHTSVPSDVQDIVAWVEHMLVEQEFDVRFLAMDNEPELWGVTHYDVHPTCTTYEEILTKYLDYATAVREVAPEVELLGPVTCCWYFYWNSAAGWEDKAKHGNQDFLPWFLDQVRAHDEQHGIQTIDVLDIRFYPEDVYNEETDPETAALRLRSTRSLWDRSYVEETWIQEPIYLIPRMKELIAEHYPGLKLAISEWNWGAEQTMNGALALADVLGIMGREDVYLAAYWTQPEIGSPGAFAFKMFTNYDGQGQQFGDMSLQTTSSQPDQVTAYGSRDSATGQLKLMLINKDPERDLQTALALPNGALTGTGTLYRYSEAAPNAITSEPLTLAADTTVTLPAYSITLVVMDTPHAMDDSTENDVTRTIEAEAP
jgi:hypothetical protein